LNSFLVIRGGAIGDFILTLRAIKALRDARKDARLEILGYKHIATLAERRFYAEEVRSIESAELSRFFAQDSDLPAQLTRYFYGFDVIISYLYDPDLLFETNLRRAGVRQIVRGPAKIDAISHASRQLAQPLQELGILISDFAPRLYPSNDDRRIAKNFLAGLAKPIVGLHPGSGSETKNWPLENWIELGNYFLADFTGSLLVISGEADERQAAQLEGVWRSSRVRFAKNLPLPALAAVLENTVFVGHDSGISHLAAASGANSILLFGSTDPEICAPLNSNARVIRAPNGDLLELTTDAVRAALDHELMRIGIST